MPRKLAQIVLERCPITDLKTAVIKIERVILPTSEFGVRKIFVPKIPNETDSEEETPKIVQKYLNRNKINECTSCGERFEIKGTVHQNGIEYTY